MTDTPDNTGRKVDTKFKPGQSGNPTGRPKGAKSKLTEDFVAALQADFETHGIDAIKALRLRDVGAYLKIISGILPKETLTQAFGVNLNIDADAKDFGDDSSLEEILEIIANEAGHEAAATMASMFGLKPPAPPIIELNPELQDLQFAIEQDLGPVRSQNPAEVRDWERRNLGKFAE